MHSHLNCFIFKKLLKENYCMQIKKTEITCFINHFFPTSGYMLLVPSGSKRVNGHFKNLCSFIWYNMNVYSGNSKILQ